MTLRKFITYLIFQVIFLILLTIVFVKLTRNDVWTGKSLQIHKDDIEFSVRTEKNTLALQLKSIQDFPFSLGFIYGFYRSPQMRFYQSLIHHDLSFQLQDKQYLGLDIFIRSLPLDSVSTKLENSLPDSLKNYLQAICDGIQYGFNLRKTREKMPFVLYRYKDTDLQWTPNDLIKLFLFRKSYLDQNFRLLLKSMLSDPAQKPYEEVLKKVQAALNEFIYHLVPFQSSVFPDRENKGNTLLIFEKNVLPSEYLPIELSYPGNSKLIVLQVGSPFPIFVRDQFSRALIESDLIPLFHINQVPAGKLSKRHIYVHSPDGKPFYYEIKTFLNFPVFEAGDQKVYIEFPNTENILTKWQEKYRFFTYTGNSYTVLTEKNIDYFPVSVQNKIIKIHNPYSEKSTIAFRIPVYRLQHAVLDSVRHALPEEFRNDTLQAIINMLIHESDLSSGYSILPRLWNSFLQFDSKRRGYPLRFDTPDDFYYYYNKIQFPQTTISEKELQHFLDELFTENQNDFTQWRFENYYSGKFRYHIHIDAVENIFGQHPIQFPVQFGFTEHGIILTGNKNDFWFNSLLVHDDTIEYYSPLNDQINDSHFWDFNRVRIE